MQGIVGNVTSDQMEVLILRLEELLTVCGSIQTFIMFFVAVTLFFFCYKFLRIFF